MAAAVTPCDGVWADALSVCSYLPGVLCAAYHHGEASLGGTIVGLAQDFVGSNNINYLVPQGEAGRGRREGQREEKREGDVRCGGM
jgi:hypothetical protein